MYAYYTNRLESNITLATYAVSLIHSGYIFGLTAHGEISEVLSIGSSAAPIPEVPCNATLEMGRVLLLGFVAS